MLITDFSHLFSAKIFSAKPARATLFYLSGAVIAGAIFLALMPAHKTPLQPAATKILAPPLSDAQPQSHKTKIQTINTVNNKDAENSNVIDKKQVEDLRALLLPPNSKHLATLPLPPPRLLPAPSQAPASAAAQRCAYNNQAYVAGDIVKTNQGWIRCTPTLFFSPDNPALRQTGSPAWTLVQ